MHRYLFLLAYLLLCLSIVSGLSEDGSEGPALNVSISKKCQVTVNDWEAPGNGPDPSSLPFGETGYITGLFVNTGNHPANVSVDVNVTDEDDYWTPGEPIGPAEDIEGYLNKTYNKTYYIPAYAEKKGESNSRLYQENYTALTIFGDGYFTARLDLNYTCGNNSYHIDSYDNFLVPNSTGQSGGVNTANNTGRAVPENINQTGDSNSTISNDEADEQADVAKPAATKNLTSNAEPTNIDEPEDSADPKPGNAKSPGTTPVPEPEPEPEPVPEPRLIVDVEPTQDPYYANQSEFAPIELHVNNTGTEAVQDLTLEPLIDEIRPGWDIRTGSVAELGINESVTREVFVRPPEDAEPGLYVSPVVAKTGSERVDIDYFTVKVREKETEQASSMQIQEAPRSVSITANESQPLPILVENTGEVPLTNVSAELQNLEDCGSASVSTVDRIEVNESSSLGLEFKASEDVQECNSTLIVSSDQGAYSFTNINFSVTPEEGLIPREARVPFLAIAWTFVLAIYAFIKKRYDLHSTFVKVPMVMLMMGETLIILYLMVSHYGIISAPFLPF